MGMAALNMLIERHDETNAQLKRLADAAEQQLEQGAAMSGSMSSLSMLMGGPNAAR